MITTWSGYLNHLKYFVRWFYNEHLEENGELDLPTDWVTPNLYEDNGEANKTLEPIYNLSCRLRKSCY